MTVAASLAFNQAGGAGASAPGFALLATFAQLPHSVLASNGDNTDVNQWTFEMTEVPVGSAVPTGVLQDGGTPTFSWLPDKVGGYRLHLTVKDADGNLAEDFRVFQVAEPSGNIVPPFGAKGSELNFTLPGAGSPNERGWAALQEVYNRAVDATYGTQTGTSTDGNFSESAAVVSRRRVQYTQALTADRTVTYPTPASPASDYERTIDNATTGSHSLILKCGAGATVTIPNGQQLALWFKSTGDVIAGGSSTALRGTYAARPAAGTAVSYLPTDGIVSFSSDGASWHPLIDGIEGIEVAPGNSLSAYSAFGSAGMVTTTVGGCVNVYAPSDGGPDHLRGYTLPKTSGKALLACVTLEGSMTVEGAGSGGNFSGGILVGDAADGSGKMYHFGIGYNGTRNDAYVVLNLDLWTNKDTISSTLITKDIPAKPSKIWLKLVDNGNVVTPGFYLGYSLTGPNGRFVWYNGIAPGGAAPIASTLTTASGLGAFYGFGLRTEVGDDQMTVLSLGQY